jgi:putative oxidoreductase
MKIVALIARLLLGLIFVFFGSNLFFNFLHMPGLPPGPMRDFSTALAVTHYIHVVAFFQVVPGLLLLINRYVPLALTLLAPVIVNILTTHFLMAPSGIPMALLITILWFIVFWRVRSCFRGLFDARGCA